MSNVKIINGDLIKMAQFGNFDVIAHGCNCQKNMGAGIALSIAKVFPDAAAADKAIPNPQLGDISIGYYDDLIIVNCYTQISIGKPYDSDKKHWSNTFSQDTKNNRYKAICECFKKINEQFKGMSLGIPMIGCGLAGLEWKSVENYIHGFLTDLDVTVVKFEK